MPPHHFISGGQRSGKSRHAERLGMDWLRQAPGHHRVSVLATARAVDDEMHKRIVRHRQDRPAGFGTIEEPFQLGAAVRLHSGADHLLVVDCLTLWLANWLMPAHEDAASPMHEDDSAWQAARAELLSALQDAAGPVLLVSNEIGSGVIPLGLEVRRFVDELGRLHQDVTQRCAQITLMVAGQPFTQVVQKWSDR